MEATYCVGNDIDVGRMFDQYLYKVSNIFTNFVREIKKKKYFSRS